MKKLAVLTVLVAILAWGTGAWASTVLSGLTPVISVANDAGRFYNGGSINTVPSFNQFQMSYALGGGGLNQLHIASSATGGNVLFTGTASAGSYDNGSFWINTTGGKGGNDDMVLVVAITGPISNNFSMNIASNGYVVTPSSIARPTVTSANWATNVVNETFDKSDFIYGPQSTRPAQTYQALYNGQNPSDLGMLMFVDLGVANRNNGFADQVNFNIKGLYEGDILGISIYAYDLILGNTGSDFIGWTISPASSGYTVTGAGAAPVPIPPSIFCLASGLLGLGVIRRRKVRD